MKHDNCKEECYFRIVSAWPLHSSLAILKTERDDPQRVATNPVFAGVVQRVKNKVGDFKSEKDHDAEFWLERAMLQVEHDIESIRKKNLFSLWRYIDSIGEYLAQDQLEEQLYTPILVMVKAAGDADTITARAEKIITRDSFLDKFQSLLALAVSFTPQGGGVKLELKMKQANLPDDTIEDAQESRRTYIHRSRSRRYISVPSQRDIQNEIRAELRELKSMLDAGLIDDNGNEFYARCLLKLKMIHQSSPVSATIPLAYVHGCMFDVTDRCLHRFVRVMP